MSWLAALLLVGCLSSAHAAAVWCGVEDGTRGFLSGIRQSSDITPGQLRGLASRFRRTVNGSYGTSLGKDNGICHRAASKSAAERDLSAKQTEMIGRQETIIHIGVF